MRYSRKTRRLVVRLPEDHPVFLLPEGRRSKFVRQRLEADLPEVDYFLFLEAIKETVREVLREELPTQNKEEKEKKATVNPVELKQDILSIFG